MIAAAGAGIQDADSFGQAIPSSRARFRSPGDFKHLLTPAGSGAPVFPKQQFHP